METQRLQFVHTIAGPRTLCEKLLRKLCEKLYEKRCGFFVHTIAGPRTLCEKLLRKLCEKLCGFVCGFCSPILAWRKQCQKMSPLGRVKKKQTVFHTVCGAVFHAGFRGQFGGRTGPQNRTQKRHFHAAPRAVFHTGPGGDFFQHSHQELHKLARSWPAQPASPASQLNPARSRQCR